MTGFRILLVTVFTVIAVYTAVVVASHGMNLLPVFFGDIARMNWPGQFNLDFFGFLLLSGLWMAWRNDFSPAGLVLGVFAVFGGMPLLSAYLLYLSIQTGGDVKVMLLGPQRGGLNRHVNSSAKVAHLNLSRSGILCQPAADVPAESRLRRAAYD